MPPSTPLSPYSSYLFSTPPPKQTLRIAHDEYKALSTKLFLNTLVPMIYRHLIMHAFGIWKSKRKAWTVMKNGLKLFEHYRKRMVSAGLLPGAKQKHTLVLSAPTFFRRCDRNDNFLSPLLANGNVAKYEYNSTVPSDSTLLLPPTPPPTPPYPPLSSSNAPSTTGNL